jgi:hypothetical protein
MGTRTWRAARYLVSYWLVYQVSRSFRTIAPKAPPISASETARCEETQWARVVARRRRVPPAGVKTGVASEGGATPSISRGLGPAPCGAGWLAGVAPPSPVALNLIARWRGVRSDRVIVVI